MFLRIVHIEPSKTCNLERHANVKFNMFSHTHTHTIWDVIAWLIIHLVVHKRVFKNKL